MTLIVVALLAVVVAPAAGGKPGPSTPPLVDKGLIYYLAYFDRYSMETNGTGKTLLPVTGVPSQGLHDGERWFLDLKPMDTGDEYPIRTTYPSDPVPRHELFLENESGTVSVQLTEAPDLEPAGATRVDDDRYYFFAGLAWAVEGSEVDGKVSYVACRWGTDADGNDIPVEKGFYAVTLDWDAIHSGNFTPVDPELITDVPVDFITNTTFLYDLMAIYDWSPDGTRLVYVRPRYPTSTGAYQPIDLWIATVGGEDAALFVEDANNPSWSSTDRIAFNVNLTGSWNLDIKAIDPDGTDLATIVPAPAGKKGQPSDTKSACVPRWSPSATYLVYYFYDLEKHTEDLYRVAADGSGVTNLTADIDYVWWESFFWRP
ncbi:MAG: hypothetical protein MUE73_18665 [Planctomycetes bacterium]|nr:hypothetical protein [Planctomycetota bacterium]